MKDNQFEQLWQSRVLPFLEGIDKARNKAKLWYVLALIGFLGASVVFLNFQEGMIEIPLWVLLIAGGASLGCIVGMIKLDTDYVGKFKQGVFRIVNDMTDFDWSINTAEGYEVGGKHLLEKSRLYHGYDEVRSDDKLTAKSSHVDILVREVDARAEVKQKNKEGHGIYHVFKGFIAMIPVSESFRGETYIQAESDGRFFDSGAGGFFDRRDDIEETELEWGEFERFLQVKSTKPTEAREIFTPDFMAVLYDWWKGNDREFRISFIGDAVYIAFPTRVTLEPKILGRLNEERQPVRDIVEFVLMLEGLSQILIER
jgi:hypothetical protein